MKTGWMYYDKETNYVKASNVVYIEKQLLQYFLSSYHHGWMSEESQVESYNETWRDSRRVELVKKFHGPVFRSIYGKLGFTCIASPPNMAKTKEIKSAMHSSSSDQYFFAMNLGFKVRPRVVDSCTGVGGFWTCSLSN